MPRRLGLGLLLGAALASAASAQMPYPQGPSAFDGQYVGELTLTKVIDGDCTPPPLGSLYPLTVSRGEIRFSYLPRFATTLIGRVGGDGSFKAAARLKRGSVQMTGRIEGNKVTADIASPSCNYTFRSRY